MGGILWKAAPPTKLSREQLEKFASSSFFTVSEIKKIYAKFEYLGGNLTTSVPADMLLTMPELRVNPFRWRIVEVFGKRKEDDHEVKHVDQKKDEKKDDEVGPSEDDVTYELSFADFLAMMNAFSPRASLQVKAYYAFLLYDFDGDRFLNVDDIVKVLETTVGRQRMSRQRMLKVAAQIMEEADLDGNLKLSRTEFNRIIKRIPDFMSKFQFSID